MDLHPYDGKERRFRYDDATCEDGRAIVAKILQLPAAPRGAFFDLRFYSGGMGVFDNVAIAFAADRDEAARIAEALAFVAADADVIELVADHRHGFQPDYADGDPIWCEIGSDGNHWSVLWHAGGVLAHLAYDQG